MCLVYKLNISIYILHTYNLHRLSPLNRAREKS